MEATIATAEKFKEAGKSRLMQTAAVLRAAQPRIVNSDEQRRICLALQGVAHAYQMLTGERMPE